MIYPDNFKNAPNEHEIKTLSDGARFFTIDALENALDELDSWGTQNFRFNLYRNSYGNLCIAASIELTIEYKSGSATRNRTFTGTCNFSIKSLYPNEHFLSTAKSLCIKNAASDISKRYGRGLNDEIVPDIENISAANEGITFIESVDDLKPENYAPKNKNIKN